jgi:3-methyladenine DNA glycosylase AlkD
MIIQNIQQAIRKAEQDKSNLKSDSLITAVVRQIAKDNFQQIKTSPKDDIFTICEELLESGDWQKRVIAFQWVFRIRRQYAASDFERFESWLGKYVEGWGSCDDFCTHAFGHLIYAFPEHIPSVKAWTPSENRWFRRGAAVVMIYGIRRERGCAASFDIADQLLIDTDDLVQKGYGWMLKEISKYQPQQVFDFVMQRKTVMPRTSLRYAIEKLSPELRHQAMEKQEYHDR